MLIPVKSFREAKVRLAPALTSKERSQLARTMAARVLAAAGPLPAFVVCDDREVADWARSLGALVVWEPGRGLNGAVADGLVLLAAEGAATVVVAHGDLARPEGLARVLDGHPEGAVTLVPDGRDDGTNVAVLPALAGFRPSYGPGSFRRHVDEAARLGLALRVLRDAALGQDVDEPADLAALRS